MENLKTNIIAFAQVLLISHMHINVFADCVLQQKLLQNKQQVVEYKQM